MNLFNRVYQDIFFRSIDVLRNRKNINRLKFLRKSQHWDIAELNKWQLIKLNELLFQAKNFSPFYKKKMGALKLPLKNLDQMELVPILKKTDMRNHFKDILCSNVNPKHCELSRTGGSTGEPAYYYLDNESKDWNRGSVYRSSEWADTYLGDRTFVMMGSHYDYNKSKEFMVKLTLFLQRYKDCSVAFIDDSLLDKYYHNILKYKPKSIWGYPSGIFHFSKFIANNYSKTRFDFIKSIITSSETLQPLWRKQINEVFGANKVFDHYGSREMYIASECREHNGYHIHAENIYLEVVGKEGNPLNPGELGRILVTDLTNRSFPFIRYEIGDIGILSEREFCPCGIKLPILERIEGRMGDTIILKNRILTPPNFTILMSDLEGIDSFQILQKTIDKLVVNIIVNQKYNLKVEEYLNNSLKELTGGGVEIDICIVNSIDVPESGKHRFIISNISDEYI